MPRTRLSQLLKHILKGINLSDIKACAKTIETFLKRKGKHYKELEKTVNQQKAEMLALIARLEKSLREARMLEPVMKLLREMVGNSTGTGPRRQHSGQTFAHLVLEGPFGYPPSTASRLARITNQLVAEDISPSQFAAEIDKRHGLDEILDAAQKRMMKPKKPHDEPVHGDGRGKQPPKKGSADPGESNDETEKNKNDAEDGDGHQEKGSSTKVRGAHGSDSEDEAAVDSGDEFGIFLSAHAGVLKAFAKLPDGYHAFGFVISKTKKEVRLKSFSAESAISNLLTTVMKLPQLQKSYHGANREKLVRKIPLIPVPDWRKQLKKPNTDVDSTWEN